MWSLYQAGYSENKENLGGNLKPLQQKQNCCHITTIATVKENRPIRDMYGDGLDTIATVQTLKCSYSILSLCNGYNRCSTQVTATVV